MGDGAMQMNGLNVMITISKYWKQWSNPHLIVLVLNNRDLNQVTWEERVQLGAGKTESTQAIPDFPYHKYAELCGLKGIFVDDPEKIGAAWDEALGADRPVILEAYTDPNVPPLPPHITLKDAKNFMTMLLERAGTGLGAEEHRQGDDRVGAAGVIRRPPRHPCATSTASPRASRRSARRSAPWWTIPATCRRCPGIFPDQMAPVVRHGARRARIGDAALGLSLARPRCPATGA